MDGTGLGLKDRRILYELDLNSRQPSAKIAKKTHLLKQTVNYRIKSLAAQGVIKSFPAVLDTGKLGLGGYQVYLQFQNLSERKEKEITRCLVGNPSVVWAVRCEGKWDLIAMVLAPSVIRFNDFLKAFLRKFGKFVLARAFSVFTDGIHLNKKYLLDEENLPSARHYFGGEPAKTKLDALDEKILSLLSDNARMPIKGVAKACGVAGNTVAYRIRKLVGEKVVLGFAVIIDFSRVGYQYYQVFIKLNDAITREREREFINFLEEHKNVVFIGKYVADWQMELEMHVENPLRFHQLMLEFRNRFGDAIRGQESVLVLEILKEKYFPR